MTPIASIPTTLSDADLIAASRSGDRGAFSQIVRKYQAMVSGLAYSVCGDLHRSEDVAQETFISAWKSLSGLRDASKLPGWLCKIARRRLNDISRKSSSTEVPFIKAFASGGESEVPAPEGADSASAEECELLWRTLSRIPPMYRETLVLFYRHGQSTAQVAAATESTEATVRQRLTRGRQMLRDEIAAAVERDLARTAPTSRFTLQVVTALPALSAQSAGLGATAKGAATIKGGGLLAGALAWLAPLGFFVGLVFATIQDVRQSANPRQRRMNLIIGILNWVVIGGWFIGFTLLLTNSRSQNWSLTTTAWSYSAGGGLFAFTFFSLVVFGRWRMEKILREENAVEAPFPQISLWKRLLVTIPIIGVTLGWMLPLALKANDHTSVDILFAAILLQSLWQAWRLPQLQPDHPIQQTFETFALALATIVIMLNWRLQDWMNGELPLFGINLCASILFAWMVLLVVLNSQRKFAAVSH